MSCENVMTHRCVEPWHARDRSRRDFLRGMSAAALAALAAGEPRPVRGDEPLKHPEPTADTCILLWMAGGMAAPETFDPKRYTPFEVGVPSEKILCTFPAIDTAVDNIKISQGLENVAKVHGPRHADPLARRRRPGEHPALAASVSLAHRLRAAADRGRAAPRLVDRQGARAEQPGHPGVHQHRPAARRASASRRS